MADAFNLAESVSSLRDLGFFNYILPLGIFFLILYGILEQYKVVSKDKRVNALLSLFISAFILLYAYMNNLEEFFTLFYTKMSIALIIVLFAVSLAAFAYNGLKNNNIIPEGSEKTWGALLIVVSTLIINSAFANIPGVVGGWASSVSGYVMSFGIIAAALSVFVKKGSSGGEE